LMQACGERSLPEGESPTVACVYYFVIYVYS
jgi:hypothetical protein